MHYDSAMKFLFVTVGKEDLRTFLHLTCDRVRVGTVEDNGTSLIDAINSLPSTSAPNLFFESCMVSLIHSNEPTISTTSRY